jgi:hypothetical protein
MLRQLGVKPIGADLITFYREKQSQELETCVIPLWLSIKTPFELHFFREMFSNPLRVLPVKVVCLFHLRLTFLPITFACAPEDLGV